MKIPIEISARHIHLSKKDQDILFGKNYQFSILKKLSQTGQFSAKETVRVKSDKYEISNVRIIGPERNQTQLEITLTDAWNLRIAIDVRLSGDLENSAGGVEIIGTVGKIKLSSGIIAAKRHLHIEPGLAKKLNLSHEDEISIKTSGERSVIFNNVVVRSYKNTDKLFFQLDTDEANAAGISKSSFGRIVANGDLCQE